jgi:GTP-binding protein Era
VRGVLTRADAQVVFVDTPGIHKPRTLMGERLNQTATSSIGDVDIACLVLDATAPMGRGDRFVASRLPPEAICVVNKVDAESRSHVLAQLSRAGSLGFSAYFPVSARTGEGVEALVEAVVARLPEGPQYYPDDMVTDVPEAFWVAELVREQLLAVVRDELPHSIACRVTEWEWPRVRCEILVERDSQKPIVIGKGGSVLKEVGTRARQQLAPGAYLELVVKVDPDWQSRPRSLDRLGY